MILKKLVSNLYVLFALAGMMILITGMHMIDTAQNLRTAQIETGYIQEQNYFGRAMTWQDAHSNGMAALYVGAVFMIASLLALKGVEK